MNKKLIVIGNQETVRFFTLVGAEGLVVTEGDTATLNQALQYIRSQSRVIGGILVESELADTLTERIERMQGVDIPIIRLPDPSGKSQIGYLEALMEKAVGMKLDSGNLLQKKS